MPLLRAKGNNAIVEASQDLYRFVVPLMLNSYLEAIRAILKLNASDRQVARTYVALAEVRDELGAQLDEIDVGLEFLKVKMFGAGDGNE